MPAREKVRCPQLGLGEVSPPSLSHPFGILITMKHAQLHLTNLDPEPDPNLDIDEALWKLDERTIRIGRRGLAQARAALARSAQRQHEREGDRFERAA